MRHYEDLQSDIINEMMNVDYFKLVDFREEDDKLMLFFDNTIIAVLDKKQRYYRVIDLIAGNFDSPYFRTELRDAKKDIRRIIKKVFKLYKTRIPWFLEKRKLGEISYEYICSV